MLIFILSFANSMIGNNFPNCSLSDIGEEYGFVDSAPMSIISAPSATND